MAEATPSDHSLYLLLGILAAFFLILLLAGLITFLDGFTQELDYLNTEIKRSTGEQRKYWIRQRRRLWLSLIPFVKY